MLEVPLQNGSEGIIDVVGFTPDFSEIIGVEVKVHKFGYGIMQARRASRWVDRSYLALPDGQCDHAKREWSREVPDNGVGLLRVSKKTVVEEIPWTKPRDRRPKPKNRRHVVHVLKTMLRLGIDPEPLRPVDLRKALLQEGVSYAETELGRSLSGCEEGGEAE